MSIITCTNYFASLGKESQSAVRNDEKRGDKAGADDDMICTVPDAGELIVEEVLSSIGSGTYYNVKAEQIAEKIMKGDLLNERI